MSTLDAASTVAETSAPPQGRNGVTKILRRMSRQPLSIFAATVLLVIVAGALFADVLTPYGETQQNLARRLEGPSSDHWLGTDDLGRDTFTRLAFGARVALQAAMQSVFLAALIGIPLGLFIGYRGGWWDRTVMRVVDVTDSVPGVFLAFAVIAILGRGLTNAMIAVGLIFVSSYVRLSRAVSLVERERTYVDASRTVGLRTSNILLRQMLPNVASVLVVQTVIYMGRAILIEAGLSFLGLGLDITRASWGSMLTLATQHGFDQPALLFAPGLAITLTVLALNLLGDGLRDAMGVHEMTRPVRVRHHAASLKAEPGVDRKYNMPIARDDDEVLAIDDLVVRIARREGDPLTVVDGVSLHLRRGECVGVVGESGSGKSMTGLAALGLLPDSAYVSSGSILVDGTNIVTASQRQLRSLRGNKIAMVFQDPMACLSPVHSVGTHLHQALRNADGSLSRAERRRRAITLLEMVEIPEPAARLKSYPHQLSGGMAQRVGIALALAGEPQVLIADEPTTALDVTVQLEIIKLLDDLRQRLGMAVLFITHDLGVVSYACDRAFVMYAGQIVENGELPELLDAPRHPYTKALRAAVPGGAEPGAPLTTIPGRVPPPWELPSGCRFGPRCSEAEHECGHAPIELHDGVRCIKTTSVLVGARRGTDSDR